ncbi:hypothetical protein ACL9RL_03420 [Plantibacter sp. Mn2098]|uniref:hypothetical protein n=1 Tax=Plantibacter sp. Mn2098 TaxID=3395266 RepID=UPI003BC0E018
MKRWGIGVLLAGVIVVSATGCGIFDAARLASGGLQSYLDRSKSVDHAHVVYEPAAEHRTGTVRADVTMRDGAPPASVRAVAHEALERMSEKELADVFGGLRIAASDGAWAVAVASRGVLTQTGRVDEAIDAVLAEDELPGAVEITLGTPSGPAWTGVRRSVTADEPVENPAALFAQTAAMTLPSSTIDDVVLSVATLPPAGGTRSSITLLGSEGGRFSTEVAAAVDAVLETRSLLGPDDAADIRVLWKPGTPLLTVSIEVRAADQSASPAAAIDTAVRAALTASGVPFAVDLR